MGECKTTSLEYPALLKGIPDPPNPLYYEGNFNQKMFDRVLAVVGSRAVTMYGEWVIKNIVAEVAQCGVTIVSGFMYGVDALAHKAALDVRGTTIAVMAGGVGVVFPQYQQDLYKEIVCSGLVVSEYCSKPALGGWTFARRNRIVAGLAHAVLVVEAAADSGSLITAQLAKQYHRKLLAVPGNLNARNSYGTTKLLKEGAMLVSCAEDILQVFFDHAEIPFAVNTRLLSKEADRLSQNILNLLYLEPLSADELSVKAGLSATDTLKTLTGLLLAGVVQERESRYYAN